jgi:hypothetical protein
MVADLNGPSRLTQRGGRLDACRDRPGSDDPRDIEFRPRRMFRWLSPRGLVSTGVRVLLAGIFGQYSDKRELEGVFPGRNVFDHSGDGDDNGDFWMDFVSDLGDGFDPTYTIAWLLARERLDLTGMSEPLPRGRLLVMGGDQVYPSATEDNYRDRMIGPYRAALPCVKGEPQPTLFLLPGNHDWFDGLTTFLRLFCRQQWVGAWRTEQDRSYFAVKLPGGWWLWGLDIQLDFYIDEPQLDFFRGVAREDMRPGDRIMLVTAKPSWVHGSLEAGGAGLDHPVVRNLEYFERKIIRQHDLKLGVVLTGDYHHYARYEGTNGVQRITCGGGGAFVSATHTLKKEISWDESGGRGTPTTYERRAVFPDISTSKRLRWSVVLSPFRNPSFGVLAAAVHLLFAWMVLFTMRGNAPVFLPVIQDAGIGPLVRALFRNPASVLAVGVLLAGLYAFADVQAPARALKKLLVGGLHTAGYLASVVGVLWLASRLPLEGLPLKAAFYALVFLAGAIAGSLVMGLYLFLTHLLGGRHATEAFSAMHIPHHKGFLRMRIDRDGVLTIFPIGVKRACRSWRFVPPDAPGPPATTDPWFAPKEGKEPRPQLIEDPVPIDPGALG